MVNGDPEIGVTGERAGGSMAAGGGTGVGAGAGAGAGPGAGAAGSDQTGKARARPPMTLTLGQRGQTLRGRGQRPWDARGGSSQGEKAPLTSKTDGASAAAAARPADTTAEKPADDSGKESAERAAVKPPEEPDSGSKGFVLKPYSPAVTEAAGSSAAAGSSSSSASSAQGAPRGSAPAPGAVPTVIGVTATYRRAAQEMYLTRLVATLRLVPPPLCGSLWRPPPRHAAPPLFRIPFFAALVSVVLL